MKVEPFLRHRQPLAAVTAGSGQLERRLRCEGPPSKLYISVDWSEFRWNRVWPTHGVLGERIHLNTSPQAIEREP